MKTYVWGICYQGVIFVTAKSLDEAREIIATSKEFEDGAFRKTAQTEEPDKVIAIGKVGYFPT